MLCYAMVCHAMLCCSALALQGGAAGGGRGPGYALQARLPPGLPGALAGGAQQLPHLPVRAQLPLLRLYPGWPPLSLGGSWPLHSRRLGSELHSRPSPPIRYIPPLLVSHGCTLALALPPAGTRCPRTMPSMNRASSGRRQRRRSGGGERMLSRTPSSCTFDGPRCLFFPAAQRHSCTIQSQCACSPPSGRRLYSVIPRLQLAAPPARPGCPAGTQHAKLELLV